MVNESDQSQYWVEEEEGSDYELFMSDILNNQSPQPSAQSYLNQESIINNFSVSDHQGGDAADNSWCPIGLTMDKSSSLLNTVQRSVSEGKSNDHMRRLSEKHKAGNFPAAYIKIGNWQRFSRHEGDLTAKLYYAKRKLVWEVMEGALKYKIQMQWSDISAIRAIMPENQTGTLEIELSQPPLYFRENNPQPRKHTLWRQTSDFTGGQAPVWRRHIVSFKPGILDKHYEKLLQYNRRLFDLSLKPFPSNESPYFDPTFGIAEMAHPPSMPVMDLPFTNDGVNMNSNPHMSHQPHPQPTPWDEGSSHGNQAYDQQSQYPLYYLPPDEEILNEIKNHLLGDHESHVPSSHHDHPASVGPLNEPTNMINADTTPAQQDNNGVSNNQGSTSLNPYYYPGYNPNQW